MGGAIKLEPFKPAHHHENESDWIYKDTELPKHDRDNPLHVLAGMGLKIMSSTQGLLFKAMPNSDPQWTCGIAH
jgi:hypothetical protein